EVALSPLSSGRFSAESLARAESALGDHRNGYRRAIDRRLLDIVYRTAVHFGVPLVHVVSCVRAPRQGSHSNHHLGRAMDFVMPGVADDRVADHVRRFGFVGVGVYPRSGFVHLDVRDRSFFWVDHSGPGERGRARQVLAELSREVDRRARRDGATPVATTGAPSAIEALMPAAPLLDPDAPEVFDIVANESDVVDPAVDAFEETPSTSVETVTTEVAAVIDPEPPAEPAASEPIEVAEAELVPASGAAADAAEEPIVEPRSMPDVPRRLRWRGRDRAPRAATSRPRRRR
ncbi:MAG: DUF882 domain-containing protein, partial [Deltaproteobacteria bacterium]|nr:DUF882 domain-containing protein [Deltaproteobacteria bacterium]